ncbi:MAG: hypothetical protein AAF840_09155, partial [Bacteroidota bacterium]
MPTTTAPLSDYTERSARYTNDRLLNILREAEKYHAEAVEAARQEVERRGLQEEVVDFPAEEEKSKFLDRFRKATTSHKGREDILDWFAPPAVEDPVTLRYVYALIGILIITLLAGLWKQFDYINYILFDELAQLEPLGLMLAIAEPVVAGVAAFLIFRQSKLGYQIVTVLTGFWLISFVGTLILMYQINAEMGYSVGELLTMDFQTFLNTLAFALFQLGVL